MLMRERSYATVGSELLDSPSSRRRSRFGVASLSAQRSTGKDVEYRGLSETRIKPKRREGMRPSLARATCAFLFYILNASRACKGKIKNYNRHIIFSMSFMNMPLI